MVDPNRKINRLSDDDAAFLRECEQEFRYRFTEKDEEFDKFCKKPVHPPPVVVPWGSGGGRPGPQNQSIQNNWRNNRYNDNHHRNHRFFNNRKRKPYDRNDRNYQQTNSEHPNQSYNNNSRYRKY